MERASTMNPLFNVHALGCFVASTQTRRRIARILISTRSCEIQSMSSGRIESIGSDLGCLLSSHCQLSSPTLLVSDGI